HAIAQDPDVTGPKTGDDAFSLFERRLCIEMRGCDTGSLEFALKVRRAFDAGREYDRRPVLPEPEPVLKDAANQCGGVHSGFEFARAVIALVERPTSLQVRDDRREDDWRDEISVLDQPSVGRNLHQVGEQVAAEAAAVTPSRCRRQADDLRGPVGFTDFEIGP